MANMSQNQTRSAQPWPAPLTGGRWGTEGPLRNYDALIEYVRPRALPQVLSDLEAAREASFR